jgi:MFS transporter, DHA1 family, multidrug resistance protein
MNAQLEVATPEFISVVAGAIIVMLGFGLVQPIITPFAKRFPGVTNAQVGYILIGFAAMRLTGNIFVGRSISAIGERLTTVTGAIIVGASSIGCALAGSYTWLLIARVSGGVGSALYFGGLLSFMLAAVKPEQRGRASSLFQGAVNAGMLLGPAIGGFIAGTVSMSAPFVVYGGMCFIGALWSFKTMKAPITEHAAVGPRAGGGMSTLRRLLKDRTYVVSLATGFTGFAVMFGGITILVPTLWTEVLKLSDTTIGIPFSLSVGASLLVVFHAGSLVDRIGRRGPLIIASFALAAGVALLGTWEQVTGIVLAMLIVGAATGYSRPATTAIIGDVATEQERPAAVGGFRVAQDLGGLIGPAIAGLVSDAFGLRAAFLTLAALALMVALLATTMRETAPSGMVKGSGVRDEPDVPPVIEPAG